MPAPGPDPHAECRERMAEMKRQLKGYQQECYDVEQALGKALGYPWHKDDQRNFPGATEADGVCVGEHVPATIASEAAGRIAELEARIEDYQVSAHTDDERIATLEASVAVRDTIIDDLKRERDEARAIAEGLVDLARSQIDVPLEFPPLPWEQD